MVKTKIADFAIEIFNTYYRDDLKRMSNLRSNASLSPTGKRVLESLENRLSRERERILLHYALNWDLIKSQKSNDKVDINFIRTAAPALLDYVQPSLDPAVWDPKTRKLLQQHKLKIFEDLYKALEHFDYKHYNEWIQSSRILGSLASYQYNKDSDLDFHVKTSLGLVNKLEFEGKLTEDEIVKKLDDVRNYLNNEVKPKLEGTSHPLEYYFEHEKASAEVSPEHGTYNPATDEWTKEPLQLAYDFDFELKFPGMVFMIEKILNDFDVKIGVIKRDFKQISRLQDTIKNYTDVNKQKFFQDRINDKLEEIKKDAQELIQYKNTVHDLRNEERKKGIRAGFGEMCFKYLQKYGYVYIATVFKDILDKYSNIPLDQVKNLEHELLSSKETRSSSLTIEWFKR